ncbi:hypothetical protein [Acinetobacter guillouiae]|uniref:hypothetical protein n=1 Tax=Acinetobacter guillouiae TaxID=106649 RepID=UPI0002D08D4D|nr:hypothetical protein [Acinetobacter guillouiae]ENU60780.1 hypothetical protein F981_00173 [Acinetobacter guillouiae CIP 63.46]KAB0622235.1 hypothetical protein F7P82_23490 [Acinetobacter guillouiae]MDO6646200.1 hypothetical protein [Acinetobacter guillouiae]
MTKDEILNHCKSIINTENSHIEAHARNIIGRSYYYTYHSLVENVEARLNWQETISNGGVHVKMISRLKDKNIPSSDKVKALRLFTEINRFKKMRTKADYRLEQSIKFIEAEYWLKRAEDIGLALDQL